MAYTPFCLDRKLCLFLYSRSKKDVLLFDAGTNCREGFEAPKKPGLSTFVDIGKPETEETLSL